jgi:hypothetical protein
MGSFNSKNNNDKQQQIWLVSNLKNKIKYQRKQLNRLKNLLHHQITGEDLVNERIDQDEHHQIHLACINNPSLRMYIRTLKQTNNALIDELNELRGDESGDESGDD